MTISYRIPQTDKETGKALPDAIVQADSAPAALQKHLKHKLGRGWSFTRNSSGWVIASPSENKQLERKFYRIREVNWQKFGNSRRVI